MLATLRSLVSLGPGEVKEVFSEDTYGRCSLKSFGFYIFFSAAQAVVHPRFIDFEK